MNALKEQEGKLTQYTAQQEQARLGKLSFAISQVARETPALAYGMQMYFLAISNNLPILVDMWKGYKEEMAAAGKQTQSFGKIVLQTLKSPQVMVVLITTAVIMLIKNWDKLVKLFASGAKAVEEFGHRYAWLVSQIDSSTPLVERLLKYVEDLALALNTFGENHFKIDTAETEAKFQSILGLIRKINLEWERAQDANPAKSRADYASSMYGGMLSIPDPSARTTNIKQQEIWLQQMAKVNEKMRAQGYTAEEVQKQLMKMAKGWDKNTQAGDDSAKVLMRLIGNLKNLEDVLKDVTAIMAQPFDIELKEIGDKALERYKNYTKEQLKAEHDYLTKRLTEVEIPAEQDAFDEYAAQRVARTKMMLQMIETLYNKSNGSRRSKLQRKRPENAFREPVESRDYDLLDEYGTALQYDVQQMQLFQKLLCSECRDDFRWKNR